MTATATNFAAILLEDHWERMIVGIGFNLLGMAKIRIASMLPALVIAPALVVLVGSK